jgi:hypothetical protein
VWVPGRFFVDYSGHSSGYSNRSALPPIHDQSEGDQPDANRQQSPIDATDPGKCG